MKRSDHILLIFPKDHSIEFLSPIYNYLLAVCKKLSPIRPTEGDLLGKLVQAKGPDLVVFMGHGTNSQLMGSLDAEEERTIFWKASWKGLQNNTLLLACNSIDFIKKVFQGGQADHLGFLGFGDIPTDWDHINDLKLKKKKPFFKRFSGFDNEHLEYFNTAVVESVISGFKMGFAHESFHGFYQGLSQRVHAKVNEVILQASWGSDQKVQVAELLMAFKNDIRYQDAY